MKIESRERYCGLVSGTRIDSEGLLSDKERLYLTEITEITKFKKIIKYFFFVFPVCSACPVGGNHRTGVREIYSAMHNIMAMEKSAKRLTVNREP